MAEKKLHGEAETSEKNREDTSSRGEKNYIGRSQAGKVVQSCKFSML